MTKMRNLLNRRWNSLSLRFRIVSHIIVFSALAIFFDWEFQYYEYNESYQSPDKYPRIFGGFISDGWEFIEHHHEPLLALFTILLAISTLGLWLATVSLAQDAKKASEEQTRNTKTHMRAYLICGGLFGQPQSPIRKILNAFNFSYPPEYIFKASDFGSPWYMMLHNIGSTVGYVTDVIYGVCSVEEFRKHQRPTIQQMISEEKIKLIHINVQEPFPPSKNRPYRYRHVKIERKAGEVFFGKIWFKDVFGDKHSSAFALLHDRDHSTPIGKYSSDETD